MHIEFASSYEYWSQVANNLNGRLFVPTADTHEIGTRLQLTLGICGFDGGAHVEGIVVGRRPNMGRLPAGVMLRLGPSEVTKARAFLGIDAAMPEYERLRASTRYRCALPLRFLRPSVAEPALVMNVSKGGLFATGTANLVKGEQLEVSLETADGQIILEAEVQWFLGRSAGLKFLSASPAAETALDALLNVLKERESQQKPKRAEPVWVVADRDVEACQRMVRLLSTLGSRTLAVHDGRELVSLCRAMRPDLVFVDVLLAGIDGPQAIRQLRSEQDICDTPMVLTASMEDHALHQLAFNEGANDFLVKPAQVKDVAAVMRRVFGFIATEAASVRA